MPMTKKGEKIMKAMKKEYGSKAEQVFYASMHKGTIKGVEPRKLGEKGKPMLKPKKGKC